MKKLKMFGFAFMAMFVGIMSTNAFTLSALGEDVTFKKESANEKFAYEVVKIEAADWSSDKQEELNGYVNLFNTYSKELNEGAEKYPNELKTYEDAVKAYETSATEENKALMDKAAADLEGCVSFISMAKANIKSTVEKMSNLLGYDLFKGESLITPTETEGKIDLGEPYDAAAVYVVYVQNDCFAAFNSFSVMPFAAYQGGDNLLGDLEPDNIPLLKEEFELPETVDVPEKEENPTVTTDKKDDVKNPKTGVSMPVALGFGAVALAGAGMFIISKKKLFKQL